MISSFTAFFTDSLPTLDATYQWPRTVPKAKTSDFWQFKTNRSAECIDMKRHLTDVWKAADAVEKNRLAHWIVKDWGGVRSNASGRIEHYIKRITDNDIPTDIAGVASFSKILSVVDCTQYAIYDARVAASLNAVQLLYPTEQPRYFPHVPSRNTTIRQFNTWFSNYSEKHQFVYRAKAYDEYCQLLRTLKAEHFPDYEIYHLEMMLFSAAPNLCERAMNQVGQINV